VVIEVVKKEEVEKLLELNIVKFGGGRLRVSPFEKRVTSVTCFRCRWFGQSTQLHPNAFTAVMVTPFGLSSEEPCLIDMKVLKY
jgi:uncharacterized protein YodC (DUF2158 family)